ncbi:MAG: hypothetical protein A2249_03510 [Candidatus Jacksonbacteria bacterium RIFOXYA2_FULL_44_7]|uniref:3-dehydroquinate dehydratase n=1 Tax=Candidatus Jacksonbacteria bacterium RIFCSPLOWO2_02_FULL_44_20 TaxID=1798460 RepID=A0A1G2AAY4_9BACT|nr:MAG: 3-dehydroquinate dehydratase [Parcubacteria group bacterium GW2011_GWC2_44_17]OGY70203.1 MAG: hypothetical protein A3C00_04240 [Candidatus Jacksonbacteria bacterium RIFCSPHIGHO2_02_FULL_44_25]OGY73200.1 MAG: hypothetical protein A3H61_05420 [Candidatus Jacksonbacteria bacterium RIFCSPLOWO2_02_FULL_44_20]OGY74291.1 MAG: hypothetical protein A3H07_00870 [Candidatus Jacksonbacteria bacterium RIFCSPLOWO2_12_FULL_44_15b]OGY75136.1 MAG: hypothetical protein A2249_03510 [Candidatus Jacksonbact
MQILIIHGPNLNKIGKRDTAHYGTKTLAELNDFVSEHAHALNPEIQLDFFQSNHEGSLIDYIQERSLADGILMNPGALSHYSYALSDALRDFRGKKVEVHLSDIKNREHFRANTVTGDACDAIFSGKKEESYKEGLTYLYQMIAGA